MSCALRRLGFFAPLVLTVACSIRVTPFDILQTYQPPCRQPPAFRMRVVNDGVPGPISLTSGHLIVNGESFAMRSVTGTWGEYNYVGDVPYDGEIRFRYLFRYTTGTPAGTAHTIYSPQTSYYVRTVFPLSWRSAAANTVPDSFASERPRKVLLLTQLEPPGFIGTRTITATLTLQNDETNPITIARLPSVTERSSGASIPEISISGVLGSQTAGPYPITLQPGGTADYAVTFTASLTPTITSVSRSAGIRASWFLGNQGPCSFGPIWVDARLSVNPP